jgi:RNA polymerase sigma-70 factor (ECF subfamily)
MGINEKNVVSQIKMKNENALDFILSQYGGLIKSIIGKHLYNMEQLNEECMDDVLLSVWNNIDKFHEEKNSLKNWLAAITKYKCIDYKRKYLKYTRHENIDEMEADLFSEDRFMENEISLELQSLLKNLKKEDQELFIKHYIDEQDIGTIARETEVKSSVIYNRLSRGKKRLRILAAKNGEKLNFNNEVKYEGYI